MALNNQAANADKNLDRFMQGANALMDQIQAPALSDIVNLSTKGSYSKYNT